MIALAKLFKLLLDNMIGIVIGACIVSLINIFILIPLERKEAVNAYIAELAVADAKNEAVAKNRLSDLQSKSDYDFCVDSLTRRKLPVDVCEQLLGVGKE